MTNVRTWLVAAIGAGILVIAGVGGYLIGAAANDHEGGGPGMSRYDNRGPGGPGFRGRLPDPRGNFPSRGATPG
jgi:hypothetical protein